MLFSRPVFDTFYPSEMGDGCYFLGLGVLTSD